MRLELFLIPQFRNILLDSDYNFYDDSDDDSDDLESSNDMDSDEDFDDEF